MEKIIIIPARKNSKRLINKNIKILGDISLIEHTINFAKKTGYKTFVTSDSDTIGEICKKYKFLNFHKREDYLSQDNTPTIDVLIDIIKKFSLFNNTIILLQPTSPFRSLTTLKNCLDNFDIYKDTVCTIEKIINPRIGKIVNNIYKPINYKIGNRTQDIEILYKENGNIYIFNSKTLLENKYYKENMFSVEIKNEEVIDIDEEKDFLFAESLIKLYNKNGNRD